MDMPKPGDAHRKLGALVGDWAGDETLHPSPWDPAGGTATGRITNRWAVDGFAVVQEYEQRRGDEVTFRGHGVFWFDPAAGDYVMHWWDSLGGIGGAYRGRFEGDTLTLGAPMPQGGHTRTSWTVAGPDAHVFLMEISPDGETWHPAMQGEYRKTVAPRRATAGRAARKKPVARVRKKASAAVGRSGRSRPAKAVSTKKRAARKAATKKVASKTARKAGRRAARR